MRLLVLISEKKTIIQENSIPPSLDGPIAHVYMGNFHLAEVGSGKIKWDPTKAGWYTSYMNTYC